MVFVQAVTPETTPVGSTVATPVAVLLHMPPVATSVKFTVVPGHRVKSPVIAPATGSGFTVTTAVAVNVPQLLETV